MSSIDSTVSSTYHGLAPATPSTIPPVLRSPLEASEGSYCPPAAPSGFFSPAHAHTPSPTSVNRLFPAGVCSISTITRFSGATARNSRTLHSFPSNNGPSTGHSSNYRLPSLPSEGSARRFDGTTAPSTMQSCLRRAVFTPNVRKRPLAAGSSSVLRTRTPGGVSVATAAEDLAGTAIVAVTGGRGKALGEIGIASFDPRAPGIVLAQFSDSYTFAGLVKKITVLNPNKILLPNTICDPSKVLYSTLCGEFGEETVAPLSRFYFRATVGVDRLSLLCQPSYSGILPTIGNAYYCSAAAAALFDYLEQAKSISFRSGTLKVEIQCAESTMFIDADSVRRLELVSGCGGVSCSSDQQRARQSVFSCIRRTHTAGGARRLRAELLQPSVNLESILSRQECVRELVENPELLYHLRAVVGRFLDIEKVHCFCIQKHAANAFKNVELRLNSVMALKSSLDVVEALYNALQSANSSMFVTLRSLLIDENYDALVTKLRTIMHEDIEPSRSPIEQKVRRCYAIKPYINGLLDVARRLYTETTDSFIGYVASLADQHALPLRAACNSARGFHITAHLGKHTARRDLPNELIQVQKRRDSYVFTTETIMQLNAKADYTAGEIAKMSNVIVCSLLDQLAPHLGFLYQLTEVVTSVDLLVSFAEWSLGGATCCPRLIPLSSDDTSCRRYGEVDGGVSGGGGTDNGGCGEGGTNGEGGGGLQHLVLIRGGYHPLLQAVADRVVVENDTIMKNEQRLMLITGANMSGKSTYLKQVAIIQILAQLGCFVPAASACLSLVRRIHYCSGYENSVDGGLSAFTAEMRGMCGVMRALDANSLVLLDEPCRATNVVDATALCWSFCEHLMRSRCLAIVTTHYQRLANLQLSYYTLMTNWHFGECDADEANNGDSRHQLSAGALSRRGYGVLLASHVALPDTVIARATTILNTLTTSQSTYGEQDQTDSSHGRSLFNIAERLAAILIANSDKECESSSIEDVRQSLIDLRQCFVNLQAASSVEVEAN